MMAQKKTSAWTQSGVEYCPRRISLLTVASLAALLLATGCGGASNKAGGIDKAGGFVTAAPVELRLVNTRGEEAQPFLDELARLSGGALRMTGDEQFEKGKLSAETDALHVVQSGKADIAIVPTRAYDFIGVKSFDALMDPMLIDNMELQHQVLTDSVVTEMLQGVSSAGLTGIGVLPGPIKLPAGITRRLLGPTTYSGARIAFTPAEVSKRSLRALGALPVEFPLYTGAHVSGFDGLEQTANDVAVNEYDGVVRWITANVGLWPRPLAIVAHTDSWGKLNQTQQGWLVQAAKAALPATVALQSDTEEIANMCRRNRVKIISASDGQIAQLRDALRPVDRWLRTDGTTAGYLDRIQAIKSKPGAKVSGQPIDCAELTHQSSTGAPRSTSAIDGNYSLSYTDKELVAAGAPRDGVVPENWGEFRLVLDRGRFASTQHNAQACTWNYGTFAFDGKILELSMADGGGKAPSGSANKPGELFDYEVSSYHDSMKWSVVPDKESPGGWTLKPWHRETGKPSADHLEKQCLPPAGWGG
jgi:TRAP-type transport system periplasmic protein